MSSTPRLVAETYQTSKADGTVEFGFTFKREGSDDTEFDLVVGHITACTPPIEALRGYTERIKAMQWAADAIVKEQP